MQAYEFSSVVEDNGIIHIPSQYLQNISSPVKAILLTNDETRVNKEKKFTAIKLKTKDLNLTGILQMNGGAFVDTNIFIYLYSEDESEKQKIAQKAINKNHKSNGFYC